MQDLSTRFPFWLCDIWGVVHDGIAAFPKALDALKRHRGNGGTVTLITNAPRSADRVKHHLATLGVTAEHYDLVVTSGDVTRDLMTPYAGRSIHYVGPNRDLGMLDGLDLTQSPIAEAEAVLCVGLVDDNTETPADYEDALKAMRVRNLKMICANPDKVVRRGERLIYCAGALAARYAELGGEVEIAGKPAAPIYDLALKKLTEFARKPVGKNEILAVGDGPETDIRGAADFGLTTVLIAGGISEVGIDPQALEASIRVGMPHAKIVRSLPELAWSR
jgi:HAD superfamily hydrolase (TIGR01459 family)